MARRSFSLSLLSSRRGIEIAISTIVVMVLGIIIIAGGILMLTDLLNAGGDTSKAFTAEHIKAVERMMADGQLVAVAPLTQMSPAAKPVSFGLGIDNRLDADKNFIISVDYSPENPGGMNVERNWTKIFLKQLRVAQNERQTAVIVVGANKSKTVPVGTYTFIVKADYTDAAGTHIYDSPRFFTVVVK
jgi:hypothetical protein